MTAFARLAGQARPFVARVDALSLRERLLVFGAGVALIYVAWHVMLMDPLAVRAKAAEQRLTDAHRQMAVIDQVGAAFSQDPVVAAGARNRALEQRLGALQGQLDALAQGYVAPERMPQLLRELLAQQHGLKLVSLTNLPVESLSQPAGANPTGTQASTAQAVGSKPGVPVAADDRGPFLHPVEMVVDGDYGSVVAYLRALEALPWRIHWQRVEVTSGTYPTNRVRITIGALSLSRRWMTV